MNDRYMKNNLPFSTVCHNDFGRKAIQTSARVITQSNLLKELEKALPTHQQNRKEIIYLDRYYRGDQPILYRKKKVRPEISNKEVENHAFELVESKTAEMSAEPIQYVQRGTDPDKSLSVKKLNDYMELADKQCYDVELFRWRSITGTAYRFVPVRSSYRGDADAPICIQIEDPADTFVCYFAGSKAPAYSVQMRYDEKDELYYYIYTIDSIYTVPSDLSTVTRIGENANGYIPVIEYPNNERRLSDIEITILLTDSMNKQRSDRMNSIEQFVQALMKFKNCDIDKDTFLDMVGLGAISVKDSGEGQSDVEMMTADLNQSNSQLLKEDTYQNFLVIQGKASREANTGGDTGQAVGLRNGHVDAEKRSKISEPIFKRSERQFLRLVLNRLRIYEKTDYTPLNIEDIEIKLTRSKTDNLLVKAEVLQILLACGIEYGRAIKTVELWSDPEEVAIESHERLDYLYPSTAANIATAEALKSQFASAGAQSGQSGQTSQAAPEITSHTASSKVSTGGKSASASTKRQSASNS